jgi:hypothetical protein
MTYYLNKIKMERMKKLNFYINEYNKSFDIQVNNLIREAIDIKLPYSANQLSSFYVEPIYSNKMTNDIAKYILLDNYPEESMDVDNCNSQIHWIKSQLKFHSILNKYINIYSNKYKTDNLLITYHKKIIYDTTYEEKPEKILYHCAKFDFDLDKLS